MIAETAIGIILAGKFISAVCKDQKFRDYLKKEADYCEKKAKGYKNK